MASSDLLHATALVRLVIARDQGSSFGCPIEYINRVVKGRWTVDDPDPSPKQQRVETTQSKTATPPVSLFFVALALPADSGYIVKEGVQCV